VRHALASAGPGEGRYADVCADLLAGARACTLKSAEGCASLGAALDEVGDRVKALSATRLACEHDSQDGCATLAQRYKKGDGPSTPAESAATSAQCIFIVSRVPHYSERRKRNGQHVPIVTDAILVDPEVWGRQP
jgi:hypothetical protein